eukprot:460317_1
MEAFLLNRILLCLLLFLGDVTSYTRLCNTASPCPTTVNCPINEDCTITCNGDACRSITINCPSSSNKCDVTCDGTGSRPCEGFTIDARNTNGGSLIVSAGENQNSMRLATIYCPPSGSCDITCFEQRACDGGTQIIGSTGSLLTVNANANSAFYDGIIICGSEGTCTLNCNDQDACRQVTIDGRNKINTDITLTSIGINSFYDGFIYGIENGQMTIRCEKQGACRNAFIQAHILSTFLNIIAETDYGILEATNIYCPNNGGNKAPTCQITCASNGCLRSVTVYAVESFHDVGIYCATGSGSPCNNNNELVGLTLKCKSDYSYSCTMQLNSGTYDEMHCDPISAFCETYELTGTSEPTTKSPTTNEPTTKSPTTSQPTTKSPTTSQPTTKNPTTSQPTTKSPITSQPTTKSPTISEPTTSEPTTSEPTTSEPTTSESLTPTAISSTPTTITNSPTSYT